MQNTYFSHMNFFRAWFAGRWWESLIKIAVVAACIAVIVQQMQNIGNVREQQLLIKKSISEKWLWFVGMVALMPLNWLLEALKWRIMMNTVTKVSFVQSIKSAVMGVSAGVATPWRSGEFIGRLFPISEEMYLHSFYFSMLGGLAQAFVTAAVGLAFLPAFLPSPFFAGVCMGISIVFLAAFFHFDKVAKLMPRLPVLDVHLRNYERAKHPSFNILFAVLLLSALRYGVYAFQWFLAADMLDVSDNFIALIAAVTVSLLLQSVAPALPLLDVAIRSGIALFVFSVISENTIAIVASTIIIWMLNLATPALLGSLWMLHDGYAKRRERLKETLRLLSNKPVED